MAVESAPKAEALETGYESGTPPEDTQRAEKPISLPIETSGVQETVSLHSAVETEVVEVIENHESDAEGEEDKTFWEHVKSAADSVKTEVVDFLLKAKHSFQEATLVEKIRIAFTVPVFLAGALLIPFPFPLLHIAGLTIPTSGIFWMGVSGFVAPPVLRSYIFDRIGKIFQAGWRGVKKGWNKIFNTQTKEKTA